MSTTSITSLFTSIPKFAGTNWVGFKKDVEVFFQLDGIWAVITGTELKPKDDTAAAAWDAKDKHGYSLLYFLILSDYRSVIMELTSGSAAWKALQSEYEKDSSATRLTLRNHFYTIHHDSTKPVSVFIESVQSIARQLKAIGHAPGKYEVEDVILLRLDPLFEPVRSSLIARESEPTLLEIIAAIKQFEANQIVVRSSSLVKQEDMENEAMAARGRSWDQFDWGNSQGREGVCFRCGKSGHVAAKCVADMPANVKSKILGHGGSSANLVIQDEVDDYEIENVALLTFSGAEAIALDATLDSGGVEVKGVKEGSGSE